MKVSTLALALAASFSSSIFAIEPASIQTESGVDITPLLESKFEYDNNIFNRSADKTSSTKIIVKPSVNFEMIDALDEYSIGAYVENGTYLASSDDNYFNGGLATSIHLEPSASNRFDFSYSYDFDTEKRGSGLTEGFDDLLKEASNFREQNADVRYEIGGVDTSRVAVLASYADTRYTNNRFLTQYRDVDELLFGGEFLYSLSGLTDLSIDASHSDIRYDVIDISGDSRDSDVSEVRIGLRWEATALTTGVAKIGYQNKSFKSAERSDFNGLSWLVEAQWSPLTYSTFVLTSEAGAVDPDAFGDYIDQKGISIGWEHTWTERFGTNVVYSFTNDDYEGVTREDDSQELVIGLVHSTARWLEISAYGAIQDKDSNLTQFRYDKTLIGLNFKVSM